LGKATLLAPFYISVAWMLMTSYQLFTQIIVDTIITFISNYLPTIGAWMFSRIDLIVFIHSFAWIFLLSSFIPAVLLGKERCALVQFSLCLTLAVLAYVIQGAVADMSNGPLDQILGLGNLFRNPALAITYMSSPYLLMAWFDIHSKRRKNFLILKWKEMIFQRKFSVLKKILQSKTKYKKKKLYMQNKCLFTIKNLVLSTV
jgi:hypothetical protein